MGGAGATGIARAGGRCRSRCEQGKHPRAGTELKPHGNVASAVLTPFRDKAHFAEPAGAWSRNALSLGRVEFAAFSDVLTGRSAD